MQHEETLTCKKCNTKKVKHEKRATRTKHEKLKKQQILKDCDTQKLQHGISAARKSSTRKECNMKAVQHDKIAT